MDEAIPHASAIREPAPAKLNLSLHVGPLRPDGYHALASLIVFTEFGDTLTLEPSAELSLSRDGAYADALPEQPTEDLVIRAVSGLAAALGQSGDFRIALEKEIPVAAGLGGGSADAAAAIRALCRLWHVDETDPHILPFARELGADVPVCLAGRSSWVEGIGEVLTPIPACPSLHLLLVNPNVPLSTEHVFKAYVAEEGALDRAPPAPAYLNSTSVFLDYLAAQRNDLTDSAVSLCPEISDVLGRLSRQPDCQLVRMSGSGPTCFGVFPDQESCARAHSLVCQERPEWWAQSTRTL